MHSHGMTNLKYSSRKIASLLHKRDMSVSNRFMAFRFFISVKLGLKQKLSNELLTALLKEVYLHNK